MKPQQPQRDLWRQTLLSLLPGMGVAIVGGTLGMLLAALLLHRLELPHGAALPLALAAAGLGAFCGGVTAALCAGKRGLLLGAMCGGILYVLILLAGLLRAGAVDPGSAVLKAAVLILSGAFGGLLGVQRKPR